MPTRIHTHTHTHTLILILIIIIISFIHRTISGIQGSACLPDIFIITNAIYKYENKEASSWRSDSTRCPPNLHPDTYVPMPGITVLSSYISSTHPNNVSVSSLQLLQFQAPSWGPQTPRLSNIAFSKHNTISFSSIPISCYPTPLHPHAGTHAPQNQRQNWAPWHVHIYSLIHLFIPFI